MFFSISKASATGATISLLIFVILLSTHRIAICQIMRNVAGNHVRGDNGENGLATNANLRKPYGLFVTTNGDIYVCDVSSQRVKKVEASTGILTIIAGTGSSGYNGDNLLATNTKLDDPGYM